jgi:hypothetical protein
LILFGYRHEIAFVFGQLLSPHSVPALLQVLQDPKEADMVRHEAAEALGSIATPEVLPYLKEYMTREDAPTVVRESCQVALDMYEVGVSYFLWNTVLGVEHLPITVRKFRPIPVCRWYKSHDVRESVKVEFAAPNFLAMHCISNGQLE